MWLFLQPSLFTVSNFQMQSDISHWLWRSSGGGEAHSQKHQAPGPGPGAPHADAAVSALSLSPSLLAPLHSSLRSQRLFHCPLLPTVALAALRLLLLPEDSGAWTILCKKPEEPQLPGPTFHFVHFITTE